MAEAGATEVVEEVEQTDQEAADSFAAGLGGKTEPEQTPTPEPTPQPTPAPKPSEPPKYAQIPEQDWNEIRAKATTIDEIKAETKRQFDGLAGNLGGLKQAVDALKQRGLKLTPESFKRTAAEFPQLAPFLIEDLNEILSAPDTGKTLDPEEIDKRAETIAKAMTAKNAHDLRMELLRDEHPDWENDVRSDEFKAYQRTLPPAEADALMNTNSGLVLRSYLNRFKKAKAAAPPTPTPAPTAAPRSTQKSRLEAAVPAKGSGGHSPAPSDDGIDQFLAGVKSG